MTKEELLKILQTIRDVEQNDPARPFAIIVKTNSMTQEELKAVLDQISPGLATVTAASAPGWAESQYKPV